MHGWYKGYLFKLLLVQVMVISVISVSSDSSEESVGTSTGRVILFVTIPTTIPDTTPIPTISPTIPPSPDYTPASPDYSPVSNTEFDPFEDPSSDHIPPLPATSPFLSSTDDSSDILSYARADLLPSPKRIRSPETATDLEGCSEDSFEPPREARLGVDFKDESFKPSRSRGVDLEMDVDVVRNDGIDINLEIQEEIDECIAYADALRDRRMSRVVVEAMIKRRFGTGEGAVKVKYETLGDLVQRFHDHTEEILVHHVQAIKSVQRDQGHMIVATGQHSGDMLERIRELEWDNTRPRDMMDVASQRVAQS
ncbi:hypothetical protein Tco_0014044 [Tanacetum coccineum]